MVHRYSLRKIYALMEAAAHNERAEMKSMALASRVGNLAEDRQFKKWYDEV